MCVDVTHEDFPQRRWAELKFDTTMSVCDAKERLHTHTGASAASMTVFIINLAGDCVGTLDDENIPLSMYNICDGTTLHVVDSDPFRQTLGLGVEPTLEDLACVFKMSDEEYEKRPHTMRRFLRDLRKRNPELFPNEDADTLAATHTSTHTHKQITLAEAQNEFALNDRCCVQPGSRRGEVVFVGYRKNKKGVWIGVKLDEPSTLEPVSLNEWNRLTQTEILSDKYATLVQPTHVKCGDFPPLDPFDLDEI